MDVRETWGSLDPPWREAFELAWESWCAGSLGIGAVVSEPGGTIVARGRNRIFEDEAPAGQVAGSRIAHAELNAVAQLPYSDGGLPEHTLYTTLEPCLGCIGAIRMSMIGTVRYAATDPLWSGVNELLAANVDVVRHWPLVDGPLSDGLAVFGFLLPLMHILEERPESRFVATYRRTLPTQVRLAEDLVASREVRNMADAGATVHDVLGSIGERLEAVSGTTETASRRSP